MITDFVIRFTAPFVVRGGKNSSEKNFDPALIRSLMRSMRHLYLWDGRICGDGGIDSSLLPISELLPLRGSRVSVAILVSLAGCLSKSNCLSVCNRVNSFCPGILAETDQWTVIKIPKSFQAAQTNDFDWLKFKKKLYGKMK